MALFSHNSECVAPPYERLEEASEEYNGGREKDWSTSRNGRFCGGYRRVARRAPLAPRTAHVPFSWDFVRGTGSGEPHAPAPTSPPRDGTGGRSRPLGGATRGGHRRR